MHRLWIIDLEGDQPGCDIAVNKTRLAFERWFHSYANIYILSCLKGRAAVVVPY